MNKKVILPIVTLIALALMTLAMVGAASAASADEVTSVGSVEVRGTIAELGPGNPTIAASTTDPLYVANAYNGKPGIQWDYSSFAGFWYDLDDDLQTETLTILEKERDLPGTDTLKYPTDREIGEGSLVYTTHPVFQEYEMHQDIADPQRKTLTEMEEDWNGDGVSDRDVNGNDLPAGTKGPDLLDQDIGLCVESNNAGGDCGYFVEGWMAEKYVAIDDNADELCKLLVEFEDDDKKTLSTGEEWDMGHGYSLTANQIDLDGNKVWFSLKKDGREIDNEVASTGAIDRPQERVYTYTPDLAQEEDVPAFSCYVDAVFRGIDSNVVQIMYVFLIDEDVLEIDTSDTYGSMEVLTASSKEIVLNNDETTIDVDIDNTEHIMGNMYFKTADDDVNDDIRFYPYVEYTIGEGAGVGPKEEETEAEVTPTEAEVTPTEAEVTPTAAAEVTPAEVTPAEAVTPPAEGEVVPTTEETAPEAGEAAATKKTPGFEAIFAIAGLLAVAYLVLRQRE